MSARQSPEEPDVSWLVVGRGLDLMVGPERALQDLADVRARVSLAEPHMTLGPVVDEVAVAESGVREFVVPWHGQPDGRTVAANPAGGNQVSWNEELDDFRLTPAADALHTSVHVRFVLRHLTTSLLEVDLEERRREVAQHEADVDRGVQGICRWGQAEVVELLVPRHLVAARRVRSHRATVRLPVPRDDELAYTRLRHSDLVDDRAEGHVRLSEGDSGAHVGQVLERSLRPHHEVEPASDDEPADVRLLGGLSRAHRGTLSGTKDPWSSRAVPWSRSRDPCSARRSAQPSTGCWPAAR